MQDVLLTALITALFVNATYIATGKNMIFESVRKALDKIFTYQVTELNQYQQPETKTHAKKIYYPILYCPRCMPSLYGIPIAMLYLPKDYTFIYQYPLAVICAITISTIMSELYERKV